jgi:hypothetical protein
MGVAPSAFRDPACFDVALRKHRWRDHPDDDWLAELVPPDADSPAHLVRKYGVDGRSKLTIIFRIGGR